MARSKWIILILFIFILSSNYLTRDSFSIIKTDSGLKAILEEANRLFEELRYYEALQCYQLIQKDFEDEKDPILKSRFMNSLVRCLWTLENFDEAERQGMANLKSCLGAWGWKHEETANSLVNVGLVSFKKGRLTTSYEYLENALGIYNDLFGEKNKYSAETLQWLGTIHEYVSDTSLAHHYLTRSIQTWKAIGKSDDPDIAPVYRFLGLYYKRFALLDSARYYFSRAKILFDRKYGPGNWQSIKCDHNNADILEYYRDYGAALSLYKQDLVYLDTNRHVYRPVLRSTYLNLAEHYDQLNDIHSSLYYIQLTLQLYDSTVDTGDIFSNPRRDQVTLLFPDRLPLFYKARSLVKLYKEDSIHGLRYLKTAFECYQLINIHIGYTRSNLLSFDDLLAFENLHSNLYTEMADNAMALYRLTGDTAYVSPAIAYLQDHRNWLTVASNIFKLYPPESLPDSVRKRLQSKNEEVRILKDLSYQGAVNRNPEKKSRLAELLIELDILNFTYRANTGLMESIYGINQSPSLTRIQKQLKKGSNILFFHEDCNDYLSVPRKVIELLINPGTIHYGKIDGDRFYRLSTKFSGDIMSKAKRETIDSTGFWLYRLLLGMLEDKIKGEELIIIPSQHISDLPFDALYTGKVNNRQKEYMIDRYTVWKSYSISDFLGPSSHSSTIGKEVLFVAPTFEQWENGVIHNSFTEGISLPELKYPWLEVEEIAEIYRTRKMTGKMATESAFKRAIGDYPVIHISTHGIPLPEYPEMTWLVFSGGGRRGEDGILGLHEITSLKLSSRLVVLDACKTGKGEKSKGYGNLNLSWAFHQAGSRSEVISLWDANDYASAKLMTQFYRNLSKGLSMPKALRQAKLEFIASSDIPFRHPYFWAGYEYYGDDEGVGIPVASKNRIIIWALIWGSLIACILIIISIRNRCSSDKNI